MSATADSSHLAAQVDPRFDEVGCLFFVIGAQKAGTTWLSRYFLEHPNVSVPYWKEHNYWNMVEGKPNPGRMLMAQIKRRESEGVLRKAVATLPFTRHAKRQRAITLALRAADAPFPPYSAYADVIMENVTDQTAAAGELCPQYALLAPETYQKMSQLSKNTRFIFMMRDPVSRMVSQARHSLRKEAKSAKTPEDSLSELLQNLAQRAKAGHLTRSSYDKTIARLEERVPQENILYVFFEDLFNQDQVKRICSFVGAPFVPGDVARKRNVAGKNAVAVRAEDRCQMARALKPVYDFSIKRFGSELPSKWQESAALC